MAKIYPVIMSGGAGTRLWPLSRKRAPKQYHAMVTERSMFAETLKRLQSNNDLDVADPIIICAEGHQDLIIQQCEIMAIQPTAIIIEPAPRNTAAVSVIAASYVRQRDPEGIILLLPSDHHITDSRGFWTAIANGLASAQTAHLVTLGIQPRSPETGFGYIKRGTPLAPSVYAIDAFKEKPSEQYALEFIADGNYFWNAGIFLFRAATMLQEFTRHAPDILECSELALTKAHQQGSTLTLDEKTFCQCRADSIDYAIMEKTERAAIVAPVDIGWNDLGTWSTIIDHLSEEQQDGTACIGDVITIDTKNSLVRSDGPLVVTIGIDDLIVVATNDSVLITRRDQSQKVKQAVDILKKNKRHSLL